MKFASIEILWIKEDQPDLFSRLIMWFLKRPYSHNAIIYKGKMWHSYEPGVMCDDPETQMIGHTIAASTTITLECTEDYLDAYLEGERGKAYADRQNWAMILLKIPLVGNWITGKMACNPDAERNCSEFVGNIIHKFYAPMPGIQDRWTPADTEDFLKPRRFIK